MKTSHRRTAKRYVTELPTDLTPVLREMLSNLRSSPKGDYLREEVFSKFVSDETAPADVRKNAAIRKWLAAERDNEATGERLLLTPEDYQILPRVTFARFVRVASDIVATILGCEVPPVDCLIGSFSGGASTSRSRTSSYPANKYVGTAHATPRALGTFITCVVEEVPGWINAQNRLLIETVPGNAMFTVPKNADIDRVACKEPDLNMFMQKGIGAYIRKRLRHFGIDLNDQSKNRKLAQEGSVSGSLATLDLSSASDSITSELVALLLPPLWYSLLDDVRSPVTIIDGSEHRNHMFSSMGNGFTFELESLLFFAILRAVAFLTGTRGVLSVYGDDIICPTEMAFDVIHVLGYLGFQTNSEKSHTAGFFRESCGGHYLHGEDITPFYVKEPIKHLDQLIDVANKVRKWADFGDGTIILDPEVYPIWVWLKDQVPKQFWGGSDLAFKYQLVSNDTPRSRLQEETSRVDTGSGGYYHWLNATGRRTSPTDGISTSVLTKSRNTLRVKKVRQPRPIDTPLGEIRPVAVPRLSSYWFEEL